MQNLIKSCVDLVSEKVKNELTEKSLLNALDRHLRGVTTIIISHRPYPTSWADREVHVSYGEISDDSTLLA